MDPIVSILRAVNVGNRQVPMAELKKLYIGLGFSDVVTYIQSGNVIFRSKQSDPVRAARAIEKALLRKFGFEVPVITRTLAQLKAILKKNPFLKDKKINTDKLHVTFMNEKPSDEWVRSLTDIHYPPDDFMVVGTEVFIYCPEGYGNSKLNNTFFEKKLKVTATTRNWKTVNKLIELAG